MVGEDLCKQDPLMVYDTRSCRTCQRLKTMTYAAFVVLASTFAIFRASTSDWFDCGRMKLHQGLRTYSATVDGICPQTDPLAPYDNNDIWRALSEYYSTDTFLGQAVDWLGGAVRIP